MSHYTRKSKLVAETAYPVIKDVFENQGDQYKNIVIPFTDGKKSIQVVADLKKSYDSHGKELLATFERNIILAMIDDSWKEHLREMDDLKQSVQGAVYEQKDPLLIYKFEAFELFKQMIDRTNKEAIGFLVKGNLPTQDPNQQAQVQNAPQQQKEQPKLQTSRSEAPQGTNQQQQQSRGQQAGQHTQERQVTQPIVAEKRIGRNEPCPCGSGKKFKQCHGK